MTQEQAQIELYISAGSDEQNATIQAMLSTIDLERVGNTTLEQAHITLPVMFTVLITDDEGIREMNQQYREQNKPTDVLSFPLLDRPLVNAPTEQLWQPAEETQTGQIGRPATPAFVTPPELITNLGDIVISWPTVQRQAREAGHNTLYEMFYLVSHGVLHLIGYDDHSEAGYATMVAIQESVLQRLGQKATL